MEKIPSPEKMETVEGRFRQMLDERLKIQDDLSHRIEFKITKEQIVMLYSNLQKKLEKVLGLEERRMLEQMTFEDFEDFISGMAENYINQETLEVGDIPPIPMDTFKNVENYRQVVGYEHPDLLARQVTNPIPTAQELIMGCYVEQLEQQTRTAVITLREKGYNTLESGYENKFTGSQFFHLSHNPKISVPQELIGDLKNNFEVDIKIRHDKDTYIEIIPSKTKSLIEWKECLDYFSENMPVIGKDEYAPVRMGADFSVETIGRYPIEEILKSAKNDTERLLVQNLYNSKNKGDVVELREKGSTFQ